MGKRGIEWQAWRKKNYGVTEEDERLGEHPEQAGLEEDLFVIY